MANEKYSHDVFISYNAADLAIAQEVARHLRQAGLRVWFDRWNIRPGEIIKAAVHHGLERSRVLLSFISPNSINGDWTSMEAQSFQFRDPLNSDRRFIPVLLDNQHPPIGLDHILFIDWQNDKKQILLERLVAVCTPPLKPPSARGIKVSRLSATTKKPNLCGPATSSRISRTEDWIAQGTSNGIIKWSICSNKPHQEFDHRGPITTLDWHPSKPLLVSGGVDNTVRIWNVKEEKCEQVFSDARGPITCVRFGTDMVVASSTDGLIYIWTEGPPTVLRGHTTRVNCVEILATMIFSGGVDGTIRVWDTHTSRCLRVLEGHTGPVGCLAIDPKGDRLLSGSDDRTIRLWDMNTGMCLRVFDAHTDSIRNLAWHPDGCLFVSGGKDAVLRVWNKNEIKPLRVLDGNESDVLDITFLNTTIRSADLNSIYTWQLDPALFQPTPLLKSGDDVKHERNPHVLYTNAKVLLVGDSGAGKTGLSKRLAEGVWDESAGSTIGAWATQWALPNASGAYGDREIWLWDFGGQADQRLIHQLYMDETALAVLVFDAQKANVFDSLEQWNRDLTRSVEKPPAKLLVAGRIDASYVRVSQDDIDEFVKEHNFKSYLQTSALTNEGCDQLRNAIVDYIDWDSLPWRSSPVLFKRLKEQIVRLKDEGRILMRFNELREALRLRLPAEEINFTDAELKAVLSLLSGPGIVHELEFGAWVLFKPELINAYGQAVIATLRADPSELGCINEERVLNGNLVYGAFERIPEHEERFVLLAMHRKLLQRGLCARELAGNEVLLVFPSYYKRNRPELTGHPATLVSYDFDGVVDEIYATLVVQLSYTNTFKRDRLWQDAAEFTTPRRLTIGIKLRRRASGSATLQVYCDPKVLLAEKIIFLKYIHDHLQSRTTLVARRRHYTCHACSNPIEDQQAVRTRLANGKNDIGCPTCDDRVPLLDDLEKQYASPDIQEQVRKLEDQASEELDNESKERLLVGDVISAVALAGHISREKSVSDHGIDMEIEFKNDQRQATGRLLFLQLKSGNSYLRHNKDGKEIFTIKNPRHAQYWAEQVAPVMLIVRNDRGEIRWMEIRELLREARKNGSYPNKIEFKGERLDSQSIAKWRDRLLDHKRQ
ncbi:TIR domain-containing protein [Achromobacter xylosoxidans]